MTSRVPIFITICNHACLSEIDFLPFRQYSGGSHIGVAMQNKIKRLNRLVSQVTRMSIVLIVVGALLGVALQGVTAESPERGCDRIENKCPD